MALSLLACQAVFEPPEPDFPTIRGVTIFFYGEVRNTYEPESFASSLDELLELGASSLMLVPYRFQRTKNSSEVYEDTRKSISIDSFESACRQAVAAGFRVSIKPHVDVEDGTPRAEIAPEDRDGWKSSYRAYILELAEVAQRVGAELFCVGTELTSMSHEEKYWKALIRDCRSAYSGPLTYAPTPQETLSVEFWDALDYIGLNAYFPISQKRDPTLEELVFGWGTWARMILDLSNEWNRGVVITEIGYVNASNAAGDPGDFSDVGTPNEVMQANLYRAALLALPKIRPLLGLYWWQWELGPIGGPDNVDYTPRGKEAARVLQEFWR